MKNSVIALLLFLTITLCATAAPAREPLIARGNKTWPPVFWTDAKGMWHGIAVDMYTALCNEAGVAYEVRDMPFSRALSGMKDGNCHIISGLTPSEQRAEYMYFIGPHEKEEMSLIVKSENLNQRIENLDDLVAVLDKQGLQIGMQQDIIVSKEFNRRLETDKVFAAHVMTIPQTEKLHEMTKRGRLFGFFEQKISLLWRIKNDPEYKGLAVHPFTASSTDIYFGVSKTVPADILYKLRKSNEKLINSNTYNKIIDKWTQP